MTRLRVYKSIAILASLATTGLCSSIAAGGLGESQISSSTKISSVTSLEQEANEIVEPNSPLDNEIDNGVDIDGSHQRRELSWWSIALQFGELFVFSTLVYFFHGLGFWCID